MQKILVTGGAGFIGHHLVNGLSSVNCKIVIIDNMSNANHDYLNLIKSAIRSKTNTSTSSRFIILYSGNNPVSFYAEDIRNKDALVDIFRKEAIDTCIHLAAKISVPESITNPGDTIDVNIKGTFNVLEACSIAGVKNFIFASSSAVYGDPKVLPISEEQSLDPLSPYGASKISGEALVSSFRNTGKIQNAMSLRIFNVFGEGQSAQYAGVITKFAERLFAGLPPVIYGDGNNTRDFIFIKDVVRAIVLSASTNITNQEKSSIHTLNVGTGTALRIRDLANMMIKSFNLNLDPVFAEARYGDITNSVADISRLSNVLGFIPSHKTEPSLKQMFRLDC